MNILVYDKYNNPRDFAQLDMYSALSEKYNLIYANPTNLISLITEGNYDILYLGILHPWHGNINWEQALSINKKPIIIDQADNDGFLARSNSKYIYNDSNCILLSRYLPNRLSDVWKGKLFLLPWYINPDRFIPQEKTIDVSFVCMINIKRLGTDRKKMSQDILKYCENNGLNYIIGEYFGENYRKIITASKAMVVDGSRLCLTQKYIEASLSNCLIIGEHPISPENEIKTVELNMINSKTINDFNENVQYNRNYILDTFANKEKFLKTFDDIISNF
ncbi:hypothetical protein M0Q97_10280 [Candidatus Dojkabacteria bacterium]|nr:hypothetical protein [Candidatus Dojkabacteria bacterium]